jgi:hypothetical protein
MNIHKPSRRWLALGLVVPALALAACGSTGSSIPAATAATSAAVSTGSTGASGQFGAGGGSNARSTNAPGGSLGKITSVSKTGFTLVTVTGEKVTVAETSSTAYEKGTTTSSASAVTKGRTALVLGKVASTTITATQVIVQPGNLGPKGSAKVIAFNQGSSSASQSTGQIPSNYKQGSGTIVSGTAATKATKVALAAYPGGIVDRVVRLSNGEYEVHNIGVNWPHHVFVSKDFKVVGAN